LETAIRKTDDLQWQWLYRIGGIAALLAAIIFRRNIGAELALLTGQPAFASVVNWFQLLQSNPLLGLAYLNVFDLVDYGLLGLMFFALYAALRHVHGPLVIIATAAGLVGMTVAFASNTAFSLLALSDQYVAATTAAQQAIFLAAGEAVLAINHPGAIYQGTGVYLSFLLLAVATLLTAIVMRWSVLFRGATAAIGMLAGVLDLIYCITFAWVPALTVYLLSAAGLLLMIWHVLIGLKLLQLSKSTGKAAPLA
jgi:hypothetical protein